MDKFFALLMTVYAVLHIDMDSTAWVDSRLFPALFVLGFVYLLGLLPALMVFATAACFYYTDFFADSLFRSLVLPLLGIGFIFLFIFKVVYPALVAQGRGMPSDAGGGMDGFGGDSCGGDGGGDGGC